MTEYIYGDVLFVINFSMDFVSLYITGKLLNLKMRVWRACLGASLGALYGVLSLLFSVPAPLEIIIEVAAAFAVCLAALYSGKALSLILDTAVFYAVSVALGGAMTLIYSKLGKYRAYVELDGSVSEVLGDVPLWIFVLSAVLSVAVTKAFSLFASRRSHIQNCDIEIVCGGKTHVLGALVDSGNLVRDPISDVPVVFLCTSRHDVVPEYVERAENGIVSGEGVPRIRAIPISTEAGTRLVFAFKPDKFTVISNGKNTEKEALLAVGTEESYGGFDALVPRCLV
ncbi:MAG: sigma-E processing peptidase SpoIIGA [Clostridiales bacterium]|nr:sigma-E processing peptidase SpoIIGA [Clostridiales bacterium]